MNFEDAIKLATGKTIKQIREQPLAHRTEEQMNSVPDDPRYTTHKEANKALDYALR